MDVVGLHSHRRSSGRRSYGVIAATVALLAARHIAAAFTDAQAYDGEGVYREGCARCHGPNGEGKDNAYRGLRAPALVGPNALPCTPRAFQTIRQRNFRTLRDVYEFASATMPADQPASLQAEQYWDVLTFLLQRNHVAADGTPVDASSGTRVALHADCPPTTVFANGRRP